jgi:hypothetical protein
MLRKSPSSSPKAQVPEKRAGVHTLKGQLLPIYSEDYWPSTIGSGLGKGLYNAVGRILLDPHTEREGPFQGLGSVPRFRGHSSKKNVYVIGFGVLNTYS